MGELTTQEKDVPLALEAIITEAGRIEENALYTSKQHFITAQRWEKFHIWVGVPTVILAALAGTFAFTNYKSLNILAGILAISVAILTGITTFLNPKERARGYFLAGNSYDSLLTRVRIFRTIDCRREEPEESLSDQLKQFSSERDRLNRECPQPSARAYKKAKESIEAGKAEYKVDKSDSF